MNRKIISILLVLATLLAVPASLRADEGMWLLEDIKSLPLDKMRKKGLHLTHEEIYRADGLSLKDAILHVRVGTGIGTGSFISPQGLIITNHHVAFDGIASVSTPQANYLETGYVAKTNKDEIPLKNYSVAITREARDVTSEVLSVVKPEMSAEQRQQAIERQRQTVAEQARQSTGLETEVAEMVTGLKYYLYTFDVIRDIRLVYAPPKSIGFFGGDDDNFLWPRHTGDFTFLRAYVAPDGKTAAYAENNVPYQPKKYLPISLDGYKEGDFTMILGFPGRTYRLRESFSVDFQQNIYLPLFIDMLRSRIALLDELGRQNPELALRVASIKFSLSNALKNFEGSLQGLQRSNLIERKRREEAEFTRHIESRAELKAKYGEVLTKIAELYRDINSFYVRQTLLSSLYNSSNTLSILSYATARALERDKPEAERSPIYGNERAERIKGALPAILKERNAEIERKTVEFYITRLLTLPEGQKIPIVEERFGKLQGSAREKAISDFARQLVEVPTAESLTKLIDMSSEQMRALNDPALDFIFKTASVLDEGRKREVAFNTAITKQRALYIEGMTAFKKGLFYPDANSTLRFTYGEVKGYRPRDGVEYTYITTLKGVVEKDTGKEPFDVPAKLKELQTQGDLGPYMDTSIGDVPVAFLSTNDITGGNSGSPILNGRGELIGLAFDGNYEGLGSDYVYNADQSRTINVDIRYVLFLADRMAGASHLFKELDLRGKAKTAIVK